jgi:predicted DCC family thiol-disulfide oxidoreductase YuxK
MATVIYDADCGFCRWSLAVLLSAVERGHLRPLQLRTAEADQLLADLTVEERNASWHLVDDSGTRTSAGAAFAPALALLPGGHIPSRLIARMPRLTERAYRWVATHRGQIGRLVPARARHWADRVIAAHDGAARAQ